MEQLSDSTDDVSSMRSNSSSDSGKYTPLPRYSHCTAIYNDQLYLWGGMLEDLPDHSSEEMLELFYVVDTLCLKTGEWEQHITTGSPPLGLHASSCAVLGEKIYFFGGHSSLEDRYTDSLHTLNPSVFEWTQLVSTNPDHTPMSKAWSGMVSFIDGSKDLLCIFGGLGKLNRLFSEFQYTPDEVDPTFGWTNEIHIFSPKDAMWMLPAVVGEAPPPCDGFTLTTISTNTAVVYGGGTAKCMERLSDLYLLEMELKQMIWSRVHIPGQQPTGRRLHAAAYISGSLLGQHEPLLFTGGGMGGKRKALNEYWIMNFRTSEWEKVVIPGSLASILKRMGHTINTIMLRYGCAWIVVVGGVTQWDRTKPEHAQPFIPSRTFKIVLEIMKETDDQWTVTRIPTSKHLEKFMERFEQQEATIAQHKQARQVVEMKMQSGQRQDIHSDIAENTKEIYTGAQPQPGDIIWADIMNNTWLDIGQNIDEAINRLDVEKSHHSDCTGDQQLYKEESLQCHSHESTGCTEVNRRVSLSPIEEMHTGIQSTANAQGYTQQAQQTGQWEEEQQSGVNLEHSRKVSNAQENEITAVSLKDSSQDNITPDDQSNEVAHLNGQTHQFNTEVVWLDKQVQSLRQDLAASHEYIQVAERRVSTAEQQALDNFYLADVLRHQLQAAEEKAEAALHRAEEAEQRALLAEHQVHFHPVTWMVQHEQIELTRTEIGRGHRAVVRVARFRQTIVAAKCLQDVVLTKSNIQQFSREMYSAALLHHPNIVRFIGAVSTGEAIILIELMPTSLRKELQKVQLSLSVARMITRDVAHGLNYLHQWKPTPIIHRGVSSSNVLLEPLGANNWRAKLSDHGATSFLQHVSTDLDTSVYSPPEAGNVKEHTIKSDMYSLGVLMAEMCVNQYPPQTHDDKLKLIHSIQWPGLRVIALKCTNIEPSMRPSAAMVVSDL